MPGRPASAPPMIDRLLRPRLLPLLFAFALAPVALPAAGENAKGTDPAYRLAMRDTIEITVFNEPDLTATQQIDAGGQVRLPLIGSVQVAGKSVRDCEQLIQQLYLDGKFLKRPAVTIRIAEYASREVSVTGEVNTQGMLAFPKERRSLDIVEVISRCGGFTERAKRNSVRLTHINEDGREVVTVVNVDDVMAGRRPRVPVFPGDVVFVPQIVW